MGHILTVNPHFVPSYNSPLGAFQITRQSRPGTLQLGSIQIRESGLVQGLLTPRRELQVMLLS